MRHVCTAERRGCRGVCWVLYSSVPFSIPARRLVLSAAALRGRGVFWNGRRYWRLAAANAGAGDLAPTCHSLIPRGVTIFLFSDCYAWRISLDALRDLDLLATTRPLCLPSAACPLLHSGPHLSSCTFPPLHYHHCIARSQISCTPAYLPLLFGLLPCTFAACMPGVF